MFRDEALSIQQLKFSFVNFLWLEINLFLEDCPTTFVHFIDRMSVNRGVFFCLTPFFVDVFVTKKHHTWS